MRALNFKESSDQVLIYKTDILEEVGNLPTELDLRKITTRRGLTVSWKDTTKLKNLEAGLAGEVEALGYFKRMGKDHWVAIQNLWMNHGTNYETDLIIITNHCVYVFEIKNYTGRFSYNNGVCKIDGEKIKTDCIFQARRSYLNMRSICNQIAPGIKVKGALVFIGEDNQVDIQTSVEDIEVLQLTDFREYIKEMLIDDNEGNWLPVSNDALITQFEKFEVKNPYIPEPISENQMAKLKKGIYCAYCHTFDVKITKNYVICDCGLHEPREEAVVRTTCEYGALNFDKDFTKKDIMDFLKDGGQNFIKKILVKHFLKIPNHRYTCYHNKKLPYDKIYDEFEIDLPIKFYSKRGKHQVLELYLE